MEERKKSINRWQEWKTNHKKQLKLKYTCNYISIIALNISGMDFQTSKSKYKDCQARKIFHATYKR